MKKVFVILLILTLLTSCKTEKDNVESPQTVNRPIKEETNFVNIEGTTIEERYQTLEGYNRVEVDRNSFGEFLRNQKLKPYGEKVLYYNGREKKKKDVYDSVIDVEIGDRDLHQCADAIMLLRGEYLYSIGKYEDISFNFVSGFKAEYKKWMAGYRIKVEGNNVSYYKGADPSNTYEDFRKYMDMVMAYSSTLSLEKELESIDVDRKSVV